MKNLEFNPNDLPSHDAYFRAVFADATNARQLFEAILPQNVVDELDLESLERIADSYAGNKSGEVRGDLLFLCNTKATNDPIEIVVVIEHKSYRDNRFKDQILMEWLQARKARPKLPILPVLFYHGAREWQPATYQDQFAKLPKTLFDLQVVMPCIFVDLCRQDDEILSNPKCSGIARLALYLLKSVPISKPNLGVLMGMMSQAVAKPIQDGLLEETMIYLERGKLTPDELDQLDLAIKDEVVMRYKSTMEQRWDMATAQGLEQGREEGREEERQEHALDKIATVEALLAKNFDWDLIENVTRLNQQAFEELKTKLKK